MTARLCRLHHLLPLPRHQQDPQAETQVLQVLERARAVHRHHGSTYLRHVCNIAGATDCLRRLVSLK